jgi:hypothetical protein
VGFEPTRRFNTAYAISSRYPFVPTRTIPSAKSADLQGLSGFAEEGLSAAYQPVPARLQYGCSTFAGCVDSDVSSNFCIRITFIILSKCKKFRACLRRLAEERWRQRRALRVGDNELTLDRSFRRGSRVDGPASRMSFIFPEPPRLSEPQSPKRCFRALPDVA